MKSTEIFLKTENLLQALHLEMAFIAVIFLMPFFIPPQFKAEAVISPSGTNSAKMFIERDPKFGGDREIDEHIFRNTAIRHGARFHD